MFGHDNRTTRDDEVIHGDQSAALAASAAAAAKDDDTTTSTPTTVTPTAPAAEDSGIGGFETTPARGAHTPTVAANAATDDLLDIKQEALQELTPLVGQLEQSPEEQFRTTMMMIQASDNHALIKVAYEAAKKISNEKERAQALLDIVNEINYFTQQSHQS